MYICTHTHTMCTYIPMCIYINTVNIPLKNILEFNKN